MIYFFKRLLGLEYYGESLQILSDTHAKPRRCGFFSSSHEWSQWEIHSGETSRYANSALEKALWEAPKVSWTQKWQERQCSACGFIQQRKLEF